MKTKRFLVWAVTLVMAMTLFAPFTVSATDGLITIKMYDNTNDTWDNSKIQVYENGELVETVTKTSNGAEATWTRTYNPLSDYTFYWVKGIWLWETSFEIFVNGELKLAATTSDCQNYTDGQLLLEIKNECTHSFAEGSVVCSICGKSCGVDFDHEINSDKVCELCKNACGSDAIPHDCSNNDGICAACGASCEHLFDATGICLSCGGYEVAQQVSSTHHSEMNSTHSGYYAIENSGQLYWFAGLVNGTLANTTQNTSAKAVLTNDITVNSSVLNVDGSVKSGDFIKWTPIGNSTYKFSGTFDGGDHTISGLYFDVYVSSSIDASNANRYAGLLGYANNAQVKNITIKDSFFAGYEWVGGIAGCFWGNSGYMGNCVSYATVKGLQKVGGVAGGIQYADATNCHNYGLVMGSNWTGGFTGTSGYTTVFKQCSNTGTVQQIATNSGNYIGGFIGYTNGGTPTFTNCFNSGDIIHTSSNNMTNVVGGFAGRAPATYTNCYVSGAVIVQNQNEQGDYQIGSFAGAGSESSTYTNCYFDSTKSSYKAVNNAEAVGITGKSTTAFTSGEVCYLLNSSSSDDDVIWKQTLATDEAPNFYGLIVYYDGAKYYNIIPELTLTLTTSNVTIENLSGSATLIVASYNGNKLVDVKSVPVSDDCETAIASTGLSLTNATTIKAFLWKDMAGINPLCESKSVAYSSNTGAFDGEWVTL